MSINSPPLPIDNPTDFFASTDPSKPSVRNSTTSSLPRLDLNSLVRVDTMPGNASGLPPGTLTILSQNMKLGISTNYVDSHLSPAMAEYGVSSHLEESLLPSLDNLSPTSPTSPSSTASMPIPITPFRRASTVSRRKALLKAYKKPEIPQTDRSIEVEEKPKNKLWYATMIALISSLGGMCFGYEVGIVNQLLGMQSFRTYFGLGNSESKAIDTEGNIVSTFLIGTIPGALLTTFTSDYIGRKWTVALGAFFHLTGGLLQTASTTLIMLYCGRVLAGIGVGILSGSVPMYIAETSPKEHRGRGVNFDQFMITLGIFFSNLANVLLVTYVNPTYNVLWRSALLLQCFPPLVLLSLLYFVPESPRFYIRKGYYTKALDVIARCNGESITSDTTLQLFEEMLESIEMEAKADRWGKQQQSLHWTGDLDGRSDACCGIPCLEKASHGLGLANTTNDNGLCGGVGDRWKLAFESRCYRRRIGIGIILFFFQQWSGINTVMYYSGTLFEGMGLPFDLSSNVATTIQALINVLFTIPAFWMIDRIGRKPLLFWGAILMAFFMTLTTVWVLLFQQTEIYDPDLQDYVPDPSSYQGRWSGVLGLLCIYAYVASFAMTWGPTAWVYVSEIYPIRIRSIGVGLATLSHWVNNAIIAKSWPFIYDDIRGWQYLIFAISCACAAVWVHFFIKETRGLDLEEMDELFGVDEDIAKWNQVARQAVRRASVAPPEFITTMFPNQFKEELKDIPHVDEDLQRQFEEEQARMGYKTMTLDQESFAGSRRASRDSIASPMIHRAPSPSLGGLVWQESQPDWAAPITKPLGMVEPMEMTHDTLDRHHGDTLTRQVRTEEKREEQVEYDRRRLSTASFVPPSRPSSPAKSIRSIRSLEGDLTMGVLARMATTKEKPREERPLQPRTSTMSTSNDWEDGGYDDFYGESRGVPDLVVQPDTLTRLKESIERPTDSNLLEVEPEILIPKASIDM